MAATSREGKGASRLTGQGTADLDDWPRERLAELRRILREADPGILEERKWRKPSMPGGVPVWSHDGMVCVGNSLKNRVRLTFPKGASLKDPKGLFNARLDSHSVRAVDIPDGAPIHEGALKALIRAAVALNVAAAAKKRK